jgi:hypothetical protein
MTAKKQTPKKPSTIESVATTDVIVSTLNRDLVNSILIVSVALNLTVFITWLIVQVTTKYDAQVLGILF